jgi:hypothetical protein
MKKTVLTLLVSLTCFAAGATGQIHDKINIDGEVWEMPSSAMQFLQPQAYEAFYDILGERDFIVTSNYRGYVAYWYVRRNRIYLDRVEVPQPGGSYMPISNGQMDKVFREYCSRGRIKAKWITGSLHIGKGIGPKNPENPFIPSFAEERTLYIKKGKILRTKR